jgi:hypothetical protein
MEDLPGGGQGKETLFFWASTKDCLSTLQNDCTQENIHSNLEDKSTSQKPGKPKEMRLLAMISLKDQLPANLVEDRQNL